MVRSFKNNQEDAMARKKVLTLDKAKTDQKVENNII